MSYVMHKNSGDIMNKENGTQVGDTKYESLEKTLKAVGKATFVRFYYDFKDTRISEKEVAEKIHNLSPKARSDQQRFRVPRARHIFCLGQELDALELIIKSRRVDSEAIELAKEILQKESVLRNNSKDGEGVEFESFLNRDLVYSCPVEFEYDNTPRAPKVPKTMSTKRYYRSPTVSKNALSKANYLCEVDSQHRVFVRKNSNINYTEPHHLVPLFASENFPGVDLDREQNVVSLCSECHNWLHYGADVDQILKPLYEQRKDLLEAIGISITYEELRKFYM